MKNKGQSLTASWNYAAVSIVILAVLTVLVLYLPGLDSFDRTVLRSIRLALSPYPSYIPAFISEFGRANHLLWPQIAACSVLISHQKYLKAFLLVFFTQGAFVLTYLIKNFVCRERPCVYPEFSFPSGHTSTTTCFFGILIFLTLHYVKNEFWRYFLTILFSTWIFLVALSRLWLGVHYLTDVIGGFFLGFLLVNLYIIISKWLSR